MAKDGDIGAALARLKELNAARDRASEAAIRQRIDELVPSGEITMDAVNRGELPAILKVHGQQVYVEGIGRLWRMPNWIDDLYTNDDTTAFYYRGGPLDRANYEHCITDVTLAAHAPKLLRDLHGSDVIDLAHDSMRGVWWRTLGHTPSVRRQSCSPTSGLFSSVSTDTPTKVIGQIPDPNRSTCSGEHPMSTGSVCPGPARSVSPETSPLGELPIDGWSIWRRRSVLLEPRRFGRMRTPQSRRWSSSHPCGGARRSDL